MQGGGALDVAGEFNGWLRGSGLGGSRFAAAFACRGCVGGGLGFHLLPLFGLHERFSQHFRIRETHRVLRAPITCDWYYSPLIRAPGAEPRLPPEASPPA